MNSTSFDKIAEKYDQLIGDTGDYTHQNTIDPALFKCIGDINGKVVYDVACGNGYISRRLLKEGAKEVWASDASEKLISFAKNKYSSNGINYSVRLADDITNLPPEYFDLIVMNMALHYVKDLDCFFSLMNKLLKIGGRIVFTTNHPLRDLARLDYAEIYTDLEKIMERARKYLESYEDITFNMWSGKEDLVIYRASLSHVTLALVKNGFLVDKMIEPQTKTNYNIHTDQKAFSPIPMFYALGAVKI